MKKNRIFWIPLVCILFLGIALGLYLTPTSFTGTGVAVDANGEEIPVTLTLEERRFLWKPTVLRGTIVWDGIPYLDAKQCGLDVYETAGTFQSIRWKLDDVAYNPFYNATFTDRLERFTDSIQILSYSIFGGTMEVLTEAGTYTVKIVK